ncbi:MAG: 4a-hydroxytetrahydrobiopterin dehydratase [Gammaproteobacteria bacterium]|nr:4a-hydroxytetrahydrobiopterin dehydratase [Gammaproteobacteria bacterium]
MSTIECSLENKHCKPCEGGTLPLNTQDLTQYMKQLNDSWQLSTDKKSLFCDFKFKNYYQTMAFVNAIAWQAHAENHHPDLEVGYNHCLVTFTTHAIDGLSENDFICAAKVNTLKTGT